jgi:glycosyltransferase involved in cell wall biosynthesis
MIDLHVNSAEHWDSRFEGDSASPDGLPQTKYPGRILLDALPFWLAEEIREQRLSIAAWGSAEEAAAAAFRTRFPASEAAVLGRSAGAASPSAFDVVVVSGELPQAPWPALQDLGARARRHLLALVPYRAGKNPVPGGWAADDSNIATHVEPDFTLSSCKVVSDPERAGVQVLLVYSRARYFPRAHAAFDAGVSSPIETIILPELRRARSIAVIPSATPFHPALNQRPINCAKYFADQGATVLFLELWEAPGQPVHQTGEELYPRVFSLPFYPFRETIRDTFQENLESIALASSAASSVYLCTIPVRSLVDVLPALRDAGYRIHYDILDDWEEFSRGGQELGLWFEAPVERNLIGSADTVTAVSGKLAEKFHSLRSDILVVRNGYTPSALGCELFCAARGRPDHPKIAGYFGHLSDAWFDWETLFHAAETLPGLEFELIGYGLSETSRARLEAARNVRFLGAVPQHELHRYAARWWAAMIPFQPSTLSAAVDPLKIYEYLHFGLPVVVTGVSGIAGFPMVVYAEDRERFASGLAMLPDRPGEEMLSEVAAFLGTCTWDQRFRAMRGLIGQAAE